MCMCCGDWVRCWEVWTTTWINRLRCYNFSRDLYYAYTCHFLWGYGENGFLALKTGAHQPIRTIFGPQLAGTKAFVCVCVVVTGCDGKKCCICCMYEGGVEWGAGQQWQVQETVADSPAGARPPAPAAQRVCHWLHCTIQSLVCQFFTTWRNTCNKYELSQMDSRDLCVGWNRSTVS